MDEFCIRLDTMMGILGPVVLLKRLTGAVYHHFLVNGLPLLLELVPLHKQQHMWFMHDGALTHFLLTVRRHLNLTFDEQWRGRGDPVNWPAQSFHLNPVEFWLWGHLMPLVCSTSINDLEVLQQRVENSRREIRVKPGVLTSV
jgi:hypothetical protein